MAIVKQLLQKKGDEVWTISPQATVYEALELMCEKDVGALLVVDNEKLVGILTFCLRKNDTTLSTATRSDSPATPASR